MKTIDAASTISRGASARRLALWGQAVAWSLLLRLAPACKREEPVEDKPAAAAETKAAPEAKAETKSDAKDKDAKDKDKDARTGA